MVRLIYSLAIVHLLAISALGDIAPPPPAAGFKRVPYQNKLILKSELAEYRFYTFQRLGLGGKESVGDELKLSTTTATPVPSSSSASVRTGVVAVPASVMQELKTKDNLAKLLARDQQDKLPQGVITYDTRGATRDLRKGDPRSKVENVITVSPDKEAGVVFSEKEAKPPAGSAAAPSRPSGAILIALTALTLAIAALGVRVGRRAPSQREPSAIAR